MKLLSLDFQGLTRFTHRVTLDLDSLGSGLVALVGANGEGKTTIAEAAPLSLFKRFATRPGSLYEHCTGKGHVESTWDDDGREIRVRLTFDADKRTTEGHVFIGGEPLSDGRSNSFEAAIATLFGSQQLFLASVFAAQDKSGNFLSMRRGDRKSLFAELLLLGHLERIAEQARAAASSAERKLESKRETLADIGDVDIEALQAAVESAEHSMEMSAGLLDAARIEEAAAGEQLARARAAHERCAELSRAVERAGDRLRRAERDAEEAAGGPDRVQRQAEEMISVLRGRDFNAEVTRLQSRRDEDIAAIESRIASTGEQIAQAGDPDALQADLDASLERSRELAKAESHRGELERDLDNATRALEEAEKRAALRGDVPCDDDLGARCPLLKDANEAHGSLDTLHEAVAEARAYLDADDQDGRRAEIAAITERVNELHGSLGVARQVPTWQREIESLRSAITTRQARYEAEAADLRDKSDDAMRRIREIEDALPGQIEQAEDRVAEALAAVEESREAYKDAEVALEDAQASDWTAAQAAHAAACETRKRREAELREATSAHATAVAQLDAGRGQADKSDKLRAEIAEIETDLGDNSLLAKSVGKDGAQALEIDAAGPEVATLANELLGACYGTRFSIRFDTLREKRDGTYSEAFDVTVFDGAHARKVEALSGGERVIVGEAVSLALAIFNARKNSVRFRTLWRDETAGALDPENAQAYVQMLRRARELGGFHQVVFVAHLPAVYEAADVRVIVRDGHASIGDSARAA